MNYDMCMYYFDMFSVEKIIVLVCIYVFDVMIVVKFIVFVGFVMQMCVDIGYDGIIFLLEFLCEGCVFYDNLYFLCIVVGDYGFVVQKFVDLLVVGVICKDMLVFFIGLVEVEVIKLFLNIYFVLCVVYFNELDSYVMLCGLNM